MKSIRLLLVLATASLLATAIAKAGDDKAKSDDPATATCSKDKDCQACTHDKDCTCKACQDAKAAKSADKPAAAPEDKK